MQHWPALMKYLDNLAAQFAKAGEDMTKWSTPYGDWVPAGPKVGWSLCLVMRGIVVNLQPRRVVGLPSACVLESRYIRTRAYVTHV